MRAIYLVNGKNDMEYEDFAWWNVQAFNSREDAERFIIEKQEEYLRDEMRRDELDDKWRKGVITEEEKDEYRHIADKWMRIIYHYDPKTEWFIEEIQFQE